MSSLAAEAGEAGSMAVDRRSNRPPVDLAVQSCGDLSESGMKLCRLLLIALMTFDFDANATTCKLLRLKREEQERIPFLFQKRRPTEKPADVEWKFLRMSRRPLCLCTSGNACVLLRYQIVTSSVIVAAVSILIETLAQLDASTSPKMGMPLLLATVVVGKVVGGQVKVPLCCP